MSTPRRGRRARPSAARRGRCGYCSTRIRVPHPRPTPAARGARSRRRRRRRRWWRRQHFGVEGGIAALEAAAPAGIELGPKGYKGLELGDVGVLCAVLRRQGIRDRVTRLDLWLSTDTHAQ